MEYGWKAEDRILYLLEKCFNPRKSGDWLEAGAKCGLGEETRLFQSS